jgi:predicted lipoprotein
MDYALAISPNLKIDAEEFASAWNKDSKSLTQNKIHKFIL